MARPKTLRPADFAVMTTTVLLNVRHDLAAPADQNPMMAPGPVRVLGKVPPDAAFWGKAVAAAWNLRLDNPPGTMLDLSTVTEVQVWFQYEAFLQLTPSLLESDAASATSLRAAPAELYDMPDGGSILTDTTGVSYMIKDCAKLLLGPRIGEALRVPRPREDADAILASLPYGGRYDRLVGSKLDLPIRTAVPTDDDADLS